MTVLHQLWIASVLAAAAFFAAGAMFAAVRHRRGAGASAASPEQPDASELTALRQRVGQAEAALAQLRTAEQQARGAEHKAREEVSALRQALEAQQQSKAAAARTVMDAGRGDAEAKAEVVSLQRKLAAAEAALGAEQARARRAEATAHAAAEPLGGELAQQAQELQRRLADVERSLSERSGQLRDAMSQVELLKSRASEADALRAEYLRLRTQANEMEFLSKEVERLSEALKSAQSLALGGQARAPRQVRAAEATSGSITDALSGALARFNGPQMRSIAIADNVGFPISSQGDDGLELAAYAALLHDVAQRAKQFLPMATPASVEMIDEQGARVTVWPFDVAGDRLLLVNLAVAATEHDRVEAMLSDVAAILAPAKFESQTSA